MRRCVCPGSFDPPTLGHLDVIVRAAELFDEVVVAVVHNPSKPGRLPVPLRLALIEESLAAVGVDGGRVRPEALSGGLLAEFCRDRGATAVVKGVRSPADWQYEAPMAVMNRSLTGVETVFLMADPRWHHVSSSLVVEVAALGGDVSALVPPAVLPHLPTPAPATKETHGRP